MTKRFQVVNRLIYSYKSMIKLLKRKKLNPIRNSLRMLKMTGKINSGILEIIKNKKDSHYWAND